MSIPVKANSKNHNLSELSDIIRLANVKSATFTFNRGATGNNSVLDLTFDTENSGIYTLAVYPAGSARKLALGRRTGEGFELQWEIKS